jgi:hypothetical protein
MNANALLLPSRAWPLLFWGVMKYASAAVWALQTVHMGGGGSDIGLGLGVSL